MKPNHGKKNRNKEEEMKKVLSKIMDKRYTVSVGDFTKSEIE